MNTNLIKSEREIENINPSIIVNSDYFLSDWKKIIPRYIGGGIPSRDTYVYYCSHIKQFLGWCAVENVYPLALTDFQARLYLDWLYGQSYKRDTISVKVIAIRAFYQAAISLGLIRENPFGSVKVKNAAAEEKIDFFTPDQLGEICSYYNKESNPIIKYRNLSIVYLMGVEGLRNVEVHRLNREDIDWKTNSIYIRGKGHDRRIFPCTATMEYIKEYEGNSGGERDSSNGTPLFLSDSGRNKNARMSRNGIRFVINTALICLGLKKKGVSCHTFRHSTGTNLYAATKDIRLVQETLGHRDIKTTSRYAHVVERMEKRQTQLIAPMF